MAWTDAARTEPARRSGRYATDLSDREQALLAPLMPAPKRVGRPRATDLRAVLDAILCIASTGRQRATLPRDFPPPSTVQRYFHDWRDGGLLRALNRRLAMAARELEGREASPAAGVIDSRSVKTTESGGVRGHDAGKRVNGRKRRIVTDTLGLMVGLVVHSAGVQDRDGAPGVPHSIRRAYPGLRHVFADVFADGGYAGPRLRGALAKNGARRLQIVKRSDAAKGFVVLPRRRVVERTFAWLGRCRRLAKDGEPSIDSAEARMFVAHIRLLTRRLARYCYVA